MNLKDMNSRVMDLDEIKYTLSKTSIIDKIEFSGITKYNIKSKLEDLRTRQVPERKVFLNLPDEEVVFHWFKNWLHPSLKHWVQVSPKDKRGLGIVGLQKDVERDLLHFYENGQGNFKYTLQEIEEWANS